MLASDIGNMMPLVYTPTVGLGCQLFSLLFQFPRGLFITIKDKGHVYDILKVLNQFYSIKNPIKMLWYVYRIGPRRMLELSL